MSTALEIIPGHWGRGWNFETQPDVIAIYLSSNLKRAIVRYTVPYYRFGEALLEKGTDRAWKIVSMKIIGIE